MEVCDHCALTTVALARGAQWGDGQRKQLKNVLLATLQSVRESEELLSSNEGGVGLSSLMMQWKK